MYNAHEQVKYGLLGVSKVIHTSDRLTVSWKPKQEHHTLKVTALGSIKRVPDV